MRQRKKSNCDYDRHRKPSIEAGGNHHEHGFFGKAATDST